MSEKNPDTEPEYITLAEAARLPLLQINGRPMNAHSIWRWTRRGKAGIRLRSRIVGTRRVTRPEWVEAFISATTAARDAELHADSPLTECADATDAELTDLLA